jgi:hypothetical protein
MDFRALITAFACAFALATPGHAQKPSDPPTPELAEPAPDAATIAATTVVLQDFYQALFFETGLFDAMATCELPQLREITRGSDYYRRANRNQRRALDAAIDATPELIRTEVVAETSVMAQNIAPRVAALMSPEDIAGLTNLFRSPEWRPMVSRMVGLAAADKDTDAAITAEDQARFEAMNGEPFAQAFEQHGDAFFAILSAEFDAASPRIVRRLQLALSRQICDALSGDCPPEMRELLGDI